MTTDATREAQPHMRPKPSKKALAEVATLLRRNDWSDIRFILQLPDVPAGPAKRIEAWLASLDGPPPTRALSLDAFADVLDAAMHCYQGRFSYARGSEPRSPRARAVRDLGGAFSFYQFGVLMADLLQAIHGPEAAPVLRRLIESAEDRLRTIGELIDRRLRV